MKILAALRRDLGPFYWAFEAPIYSSADPAAASNNDLQSNSTRPLIQITNPLPLVNLTLLLWARSERAPDEAEALRYAYPGEDLVVPFRVFRRLRPAQRELPALYLTLVHSPLDQRPARMLAQPPHIAEFKGRQGRISGFHELAGADDLRRGGRVDLVGLVVREAARVAAGLLRVLRAPGVPPQLDQAEGLAPLVDGVDQRDAAGGGVFKVCGTASTS